MGPGPIRNNNFENLENKTKNLRNIQNFKKEQKYLYLNENENNERYFSKNENDNNDYNNDLNNNNTINTNNRFNNINKRKKISRTRSIDISNNENTNSYYIGQREINYQNNINNRNMNKNNPIISFPSESNLKKEKKIDEIERSLIKLQKQRNIYLDEYDKLPEHPKKQKDLNDKRELKKLIDDLNMNINEYKRQERNLKKNYFDYD